MNARRATPQEADAAIYAVETPYVTVDQDWPAKPLLIRTPVPTRVNKQTAGADGVLVVLDKDTAYQVDEHTLADALATVIPMPVSGIGALRATRQPEVAPSLNNPATPFDQPDTTPVIKSISCWPSDLEAGDVVVECGSPYRRYEILAIQPEVNDKLTLLVEYLDNNDVRFIEQDGDSHVLLLPKLVSGSKFARARRDMALVEPKIASGCFVWRGE